MLLFVRVSAVILHSIFNILLVWLVRTCSAVLVPDICSPSAHGSVILSNGYLTVFLCTAQLGSSLFTLFLPWLSSPAPFTSDPLQAKGSFLKAPIEHGWRYHFTFYLQFAHLGKYHIIFWFQSKHHTVSFSLTYPWESSLCFCCCPLWRMPECWSKRSSCSFHW